MAHTQRERGAVLVLTALVMILLLFIAAFATDLGAWYRQGQEQQRAADVGALNGVQAYDRAIKAYFEDQGVKRWTELDQAQAQTADESGMTAAMQTIQGLLETSGLSFPTDVVKLETPLDPREPTSRTVWQLTAADGTLVTVTRSFIDTNTDPAGSPVWARAIDVVVTAPGEQYFSTLLRDAPEIERAAQSLLSNCGATCDQTITINPPFAGFQGSGRGDGYGPLFVDNDPGKLGVDEIWAVNHHSNGVAWNGGASHKPGQFICMQAETRTPCPGAPFDLLYKTANRPVEYISPGGLIYFVAREPGNNGEVGIGCFNTNTRSMCSTPFTGLFEQTTNSTGTNYISGTGPWAYDGKLFMVTQDGWIGCINTDMTKCATATKAMTHQGHSRMPIRNNAGMYVSHGEQIGSGSELYLTQNTNTGVMFACIDLSDLSQCFSPQHATGGGIHNGTDRNLTYTRYDADQNPTHVCVYNLNRGQNGKCTNFSGTISNGPDGMATAFVDLNPSWGGDTFTWQGKRTFFAGGASHYVGCWDWETNAACADGATKLINNAVTGTGTASPYSFGAITDQCLVGLGHTSKFFSFNPVGFTACVDAELYTSIEPCLCTDNDQKRWGEVRLPAELMAKVDVLYATISTTRDNAEDRIPVIPELDQVPLHLNGGVIDLTNVQDDVPKLWIRLEVNAKLDGNGKPLWQAPIDAKLEIVTRPTLTN